MNFADLYRFANAADGPFVGVMSLRAQVIAHHPVVGDVEFLECKLDTGVSLGHIKYELGRTSPYDEAFDVAVIRVADTLTKVERRFVCCKELMHVFDDSESRANTAEKFTRLLTELETEPLPEAESPMCRSETNAMWMALLVLCPERLRKRYLADYSNGTVTADQVGKNLRIPAGLVRSLMSDGYNRALELLTGELAEAKPYRASRAAE